MYRLMHLDRSFDPTSKTKLFCLRLQQRHQQSRGYWYWRCSDTTYRHNQQSRRYWRCGVDKSYRQQWGIWRYNHHDNLNIRNYNIRNLFHQQHQWNWW